MNWLKIFIFFLKTFIERLKMSEFIPRDEETGKINAKSLTHAYIIKLSDGTPVAIAIKINGSWYSIPYDKKLADELSSTDGIECSEILIEDWARINSDYGNIISAMDEKFNRPIKTSTNKLG